MQRNIQHRIIRPLWRFARATNFAAVFGHARAPVALPAGFDWKFYLDFYPDLRKAGLRTEQDAAEHYRWHGFFEKRFTCAPDHYLMVRHDAIRRRQLQNIAAFNEQHVQIIKNEAAAVQIAVSVVISLYNYGQYIEACLRSVLQSSLKDIEIIIVNDASTDNSLSLCRRLLDCPVPVTILDKSINTGVSHCRNMAIRQATGDYVFILDADNEIYSDCFAEHLACMRADAQLVACYGVIDLFDESGRFCGQVSDAPFDVGKLLQGNYIDAMAMFERRALIDIGMYDEKLLEQGIGYEDYELWLRIGRQGKKVGCIERPLSRYLQKNESMVAVSNRFYRRPLVAWIRQKYSPHSVTGRRTAVLVVGMHRSGTSALAGVLSLMGAYPGLDLIGPERSNVKGHFESRKIVALNDALLDVLGARAPESGDLPADWLGCEETRRAAESLKKIISDEYSGREIFMIKDPRLCLLLPLYHDILNELEIDVRVVAIRRDVREVVESLYERDRLPHERGRAYYEKHIRALDHNLAGLQFISVTFDQLIETPGAVMETIRAFIPCLSAGDIPGLDCQIGQFIEPGLRHHSIRTAQSPASVFTIVARTWDHLCGSAGGPDFLIIGAQRAGTTSLYHYLCAHPQIHAPARKELHWFHAGPQDEDGYHNGHRSRQWYERQLAGNGRIAFDRLLHRRKLTFEATPEYLYHPLVPQKVFQLYPAVKIIVVLRDPLERAVSQYFHEKNAGFIAPDLSIEKYFDRDREIASVEEQKLLHDDGYFSFEFEHCCPIARSNYGRQLARWLRCFSRDRMLIVRSEDLFHDPVPVVDAVCGFLGIARCAGILQKKNVDCNSSNRPRLSDGQRARLLSFFPYDLSVDKFCSPTSGALQSVPSGEPGGCS
ncbi:MAG: glycosyltransferase [Deltaproteobacteria bacterium]|nr:glycosyltransferase [Deltaproteobacteria bacterium]